MIKPALKKGDKFNRLTVMEFLPKSGGLYRCVCDCGTETTARGSSLKSGRHRSCGCLANEEKSTRFFLPEFKAAKHKIFTNYIRAAKKRGHTFTLSEEDFCRLISSPCFYCGSAPSMVWKDTSKYKIIDGSNFRYNGVDRVDNSKGYSKDNCVPCCKICNNSKSTLSLDEWLSWLNGIVKYRSSLIN